MLKTHKTVRAGLRLISSGIVDLRTYFWLFFPSLMSQYQMTQMCFAYSFCQYTLIWFDLKKKKAHLHGINIHVTESQ